MPIVLLLVLSAVEVLHRTTRGSIPGVAARAAFVVLCVLGAGVSFLSVRIPYDQWSETLWTPSLAARYADGHPFAPPGSTEIAGDAYDFTFRASQIRIDLDLLLQGGAEMGPAEFREGDAVVGWILLGAGISGLLGAVYMGWSPGRTCRRSTDTERLHAHDGSAGVPSDGPDDGPGDRDGTEVDRGMPVATV